MVSPTDRLSRERQNGPYDSTALIVKPQRTSFVDTVDNARRALHEAVEIKYFYEGTSTLLIGTQTIEVRAGDTVVINPYEFHATLNDGQKKGKYHLFMVGVDYFLGAGGDGLELRHLLLGSGVLFRSHFVADTELGILFERIANEYVQNRTACTAMIRGLLMQAVALLLRRGVREGANDREREDLTHYYGVIEPALRQIRDCYARHFTVEGLASSCNVSKHHFCRIFKRVTGMSAMQYLNEYRLKVADAMLGNTDRSVGEVASLCGYEGESYFCQCYKRRYGCSPLKGRMRQNNVMQ